MAFPCCCSLTKGIRFAGLVSALLALAVCGVSGWQFHEAWEERQSAAFKVKESAGDLGTSIFKTFGLEDHKVDFVKVNRIKLACYGTAFASAALQFLTSLLILICASAKGGKSTAKLYSFINPFVLIALLAACGCFFSDSGIDYQEEREVQYFLGVSLLDSVFLLYLLCVAGAFIRS